ncbi:MAG: hypothetical protein OEZ18_01465 [Candidatus Bathyarchaeota archaeon]|nr:hypothetical protein [Candidatus Bathyarchaeota archaeon]
MLQTITKHLKRFKHAKRGLSNVIVVMLSLVILVVISANVILWSYQMNQLDWEKIKENMSITNVERVSRSSWFVAQSEHAVNIGSRVSGTYTDTQTVDGHYERFMEASTLPYNPSGYILWGSTSWVSGSVSDLTSDNGVYMVFRSYASATVEQTLYAHQETTTIGGATYLLQKLDGADTAGISISVSGASVGRKLVGKFLYPLTGVSIIQARTWTIYYRAIKSSPALAAHCDVDILIRRANGTIRTIIAIDVANSGELTTEWSTPSGTYMWSAYTFVDPTDYLEIDYHTEVTKSSPGKTASLRIDDNTLALADQTRATNITLPSEFTLEVEFTGTSNTATWTQLFWTIDSCWTIANVNVTLQLYNYNSGSYPTSRDGYISYISSAAPNTDETKTQTIVTNSTHFRDSSGNWKIKVKGVKTTTTQFDFKADWIEFKTKTADYYSLDIAGAFAIDISTYPLAYIQTIEIQLRYRTDDAGEKWYLKAYNWSSSTYSDSGFNSTGHTPTMGWDYYAVNFTDEWRSYVKNDGTIYVKVVDEGADSNQTTIDIDFLGVRAEIDGTRFRFQNGGALTSHLISLWVNNATDHQRYDISLFVNSGENATYIRADISLPTENFVVKVVTERGNIAVFARH